MKMVVDTASKRVLLLKQHPDLQPIDYFQLESTATIDNQYFYPCYQQSPLCDHRSNGRA